MRKILLSLFLVLVAIIPARAVEGRKIPAHEEAVRAIFKYCVPPVVAKKNPAAIAEDSGLPELKRDAAQKFMPNAMRGRAFVIPEGAGNLVMLVPDRDVCRVAVRKVTPASLWRLLGTWFGDETPWKLLEEKSEDDATQKTYIADFDGPVLGIVSVRKKFNPESLQALVTIVRPDDPKANERPENRTRLKGNN